MPGAASSTEYTSPMKNGHTRWRDQNVTFSSLVPPCTVRQISPQLPASYRTAILRCTSIKKNSTPSNAPISRAAFLQPQESTSKHDPVKKLGKVSIGRAFIVPPHDATTNLTLHLRPPICHHYPTGVDCVRSTDKKQIGFPRDCSKKEKILRPPCVKAKYTTLTLTLTLAQLSNKKYLPWQDLTSKWTCTYYARPPYDILARITWLPCVILKAITLQ